MLYTKCRSIFAVMLVCSATVSYSQEATDILAIIDEEQPCQVCTSESCPCSSSCRCTDACRCRSTGCRGCCEVYTQDRELNKSGNSTCVASYCDCTGNCGQENACCSK